MSRLHCALNTNNFKASVDFYTKLFGQHPAKLEDGYAKFSCDGPSVNLTLNQVSVPIHQNAINHLGIEVEDAKAVMVAKERLEQLGLSTKLEEDADCFYAIQDKVWVTGLMVIAGNFSLSKMKVVLETSNQRNVVQQINEQQDFLLDSANSLLEWDEFIGIKKVQKLLNLSLLVYIIGD